jgi:hypothetical protein
MNAAFPDWQPQYAAHGIATFPIKITGSEKKPAIRGWQRIGLPGRNKLAQKFASADALGFCPGPRTGITILDVDSTNELILAAALDRHGHTPVIARSGSGKYHGYYRHNGEKRLIRPESDKPIDILGSGLAVAPPSRGSKGCYEFIQGGLDDIASLPVLQDVGFALAPEMVLGDPPAFAEMGENSGRNTALFDTLCREARGLPENIDAFVGRARELNKSFGEPMIDSRVINTAKSVFGYVESGQLRTGEHGAWFKKPQAQSLARDPYLLALIAWLKAENGPASEFWITNGLAAAHLGWPLDKLRKARSRAIKDGWIKLIIPASTGRNAVYGWGPAAKSHSPPPQLPPRNPGIAEFLKLSRTCRRRPKPILIPLSS